jgi:hypothetical protein
MSKSRIITEATEEDLKSVNISHDKIRIDKLRSDLNSMTAVMKLPGGRLVERKFGQNGLSFAIDENDNTVHFLGGCLGPECNTIRQPDKTILHRAKFYLSVFTFDAAKNPHMAGRGLGRENYSF